MFIPFIFAVAMLVLLPFYIWSEYHWKPTQYFYLKLACSVLFLATAISSHVLNTNGTAYQTYGLMMIMALGFGLIGDCFLVFPKNNKCFILGLSSFLIAQIIYGSNFVSMLGFSWIDILVYGLIIAVIVFLFNIGRLSLGKMKYPVFAYIAIITFMTTMALSGIYKSGFSPMIIIMISISAVLFLASDVLLGFLYFAPKQRKFYRGTNLFLYYTAQLIFALTIALIA